MGFKNFFKEFGKEVGKKNIFHDVLSFFMISIPHIIACSVISFFYPNQIFWIFLFGLVLPDSFAVVHHYFRPAKIRKKFKLDYFDARDFFKKEWKTRKKLSNYFHIFFYLLSAVFLYFGDYGVFIAAVSHLVLDLFGF